MRTPRRHWRSYGTEPLPTPQEALQQPFRAFPGWFLRIECDRCGKVTMLNEAHMILSYCSLSSNRPHGTQGYKRGQENEGRGARNSAVSRLITWVGGLFSFR